MTGDDETLDDLEELLEQVRWPDPGAGRGGDETISGAGPGSDWSDDDTIDVDPGLIRRLREQNLASDVTLPRPALPAQQADPSTEPPPKRTKRRWAVGAILATAAAATSLLIALYAEQDTAGAVGVVVLIISLILIVLYAGQDSTGPAESAVERVATPSVEPAAPQPPQTLEPTSEPSVSTDNGTPAPGETDTTENDRISRPPQTP